MEKETYKRTNIMISAKFHMKIMLQIQVSEWTSELRFQTQIYKILYFIIDSPNWRVQVIVD